MLKSFTQSLRWFQHKKLLDDLIESHPLKYIFLEITRRCNLRCKYCGSDCHPKTDLEEMDIQDWIEIVRQIASDFDTSKIMVAVTGGEPLFKPNVVELFEALNKYGYNYGMVTNGHFLTEGMAKDLVRCKMGSISISMDALPEINDKLRGKNNSKHIVAAIKNLHDAGFKGHLEIISTITKPAVEGLDEMRKFIASHRVPRWRVAPVMPIGRAAQNAELIPDAKDVGTILEFVRTSRQDKYKPQPEFSEEGFLGERYEGVVRPYLCQCRAGISVAGIRYDGRIGACPELSEAFDQGHIKEDSFKYIWENHYDILRDRSWTHRDDCAECEHYHVCRGGAMHLYADKKAKLLRCLYLMTKNSIPESTR